MKRVSPLLSLLLLVTVVFTSCKKDNGNNGIRPGKGIDLVFTSAEHQEAAADNAFTFNMFKNVTAGITNGSNVFVSPLSVGFAMGMTSNGAKGQTLTAINTTMGFGGFTQDQVNSYYNNLLTNLPKLDPNTTLNIANSIWYKQGFSVLPQFMQVNSTSYNAGIQSLDFSNPASLNTINGWVSSKTGGKIPKLLEQLSSDARMYLINAIYFKSDWLTKFDASNTRPAPFNLADNSQVQANFMNNDKVVVNGYQDDNVSVVELPYSNSKYSMVIVMPKAGKSLAGLTSSIDAPTWDGWMGKLTSSTVQLSVPKFQFSYGQNLNGTLTSLGMGVAFSKDADFTGINADGGLQITSVDQKAYIAIDETGTTASAATSVTVGISAVLYNQVIINHPFMFAIREMKTGLILFTGTMNNPNQNGL